MRSSRCRHGMTRTKSDGMPWDDLLRELLPEDVARADEGVGRTSFRLCRQRCPYSLAAVTVASPVAMRLGVPELVGSFIALRWHTSSSTIGSTSSRSHLSGSKDDWESDHQSGSSLGWA
jgi:hypothetical protein